ncbi:MAG: 3-methyl-2-oxobutanoate hydroxymethyltransferase [Alphaproteobacteria bacterium]|nr:3-methyl-2-oxobutanoate hydroxymethyltransferase [Alphaproteobacteria bacterium]
MPQVKKAITVPELRARKGKTPIVCLTAYTTPMAKWLDNHVDLLLVGDSVGMVLYGMESTLGVTVDMMIAHTQAVMRGAERACVITDLPFGSYQESPEVAYRTSARVLQETGAAGVKLEGGEEMAETVSFLTQRGIPVLGHVGMMPQSVNTYGGFGARGKTKAEAEKILADGKAIAEAGAFAVVIEGTLEPVARALTDALAVPTIGIGASAACDGQILVAEDVLGLFSDFVPKFVRRYAELGSEIEKVVARYAADVRKRRFPGPEHCFGVKKRKR